MCECPGEYWHLKFSQGCQRPCTHPPSNTDLSKWRHHDQRARVHSPYGYDRPCACPHTCPCWTSKTVAVTAVRACAQGIGPGTCISLLLIYHSGVPSRFRSSGFGFVIHRSSWFALLTVLKVQPDTCFSFFSGFKGLLPVASLGMGSLLPSAARVLLPLIRFRFATHRLYGFSMFQVRFSVLLQAHSCRVCVMLSSSLWFRVSAIVLRGVPWLSWSGACHH